MNQQQQRGRGQQSDLGSSESDGDVYVYTGGEGDAQKPFAPEDVACIRVHSDVTVIGEYAFAGCKQLESIELPEGLETIGQYAFLHCSKLALINFPSTLQVIQEGAFAKCVGLTSMRFQEGLKVIGRSAFWRCSKLETIQFPSSLQKIDGWTFSLCYGLRSVEFKEGLQVIGSRAFEYCRKLQAVKLPLSLHTMIGRGDKGPFEYWTRVKFQKASEGKTDPVQNNTLLHSLIENNAPFPIVDAFLNSCPKVVHHRNYFGQTALHLCMINMPNVETTEAIYKLWPSAKHVKNEIGNTPLDIWKENGSNKDLGAILFDGGPMEVPKSNTPFLLKGQQLVPYENKHVLLRSHYLLFEIPEKQEEHFVNDTNNTSLRARLNGQVQTRQMLFRELLAEFAKLLDFHDTVVIQQAAALESLLPTCGSNGVLDFRCFCSSALWYQQEILKLVLRVYCEDQAWELSAVENAVSCRQYFAPSSFYDDVKCKQDLEEWVSYAKKPRVCKHRKDSFCALTEWITCDLENNQYELEGPELKPLQSLFNKLYIRRGQTKVNIVGDMTRATLRIKEKRHLKMVISRIEKQFPGITGQEFDLDKAGVLGFLHKVFSMEHIDLSKFKIIPYRLKINSSQNNQRDKGESPLLYNLNFFDCVPEYHRVGNTEMIVAFELQIGLEDEINRLRTNHIAYARDRILQSQPLLRSYINMEAKKKEKNDSAEATVFLSSTSSISLTKGDTDDNFKRISAVLEGSFTTCDLKWLKEMKVDTSCSDSNSFGHFHDIKIDRLCLDNKRLNMWAKQGKAVILDRVALPDSNCHYCVEESASYLRGMFSLPHIYVGLFAHFGPYIIGIASRLISVGKVTVFIKSGINMESLERISPLPPGCDSVLLVAWGKPIVSSIGSKKKELTWEQFKHNCYNGMKLKIRQYDIRDKEEKLMGMSMSQI